MLPTVFPSFTGLDLPLIVFLSRRAHTVVQLAPRRPLTSWQKRRPQITYDPHLD